jgi:oligoribonuclease
MPAPAPSLPSSAPLVWIDLEMTGLSPETCTILEVATIVTDSDLRVIARGPEIVVHHGEDVLAAMNPWCIEHHGKSGLTGRVRESTISLREAERLTLAFLRAHTEPGASPLCGNSVDLDRAFIDRHMLGLSAFLRGQTVDVTSFKELVRRWYPGTPAFEKNDTHRALDDILESIEELRFYRGAVMRTTTEARP